MDDDVEAGVCASMLYICTFDEAGWRGSVSCLTLMASVSPCPLGGTLVPAGGESQEEVCTGVLA